MANVTENKEDLLNVCFMTYGSRRCSGAVLNAYIDSKGYPTIGAGHLVFRPNMTDDEIAKYRRRHIRTMGGIGINSEQAGREYDAMVYAFQHNTYKTEKINGVEVITYPKMTSLTTAQAEKLFKLDNDDDCLKAIQYFPDIHTYPVEVQTCIVHLGSHGSGIENIKNGCGDDLSVQNIVQNMCDIRLSEMREYAKTHPNQPNKRTPSINAVCELYYACEAVGVEPPVEVKDLIAQYPRDFDHYTKNITTPIREKYGEPPAVRMMRDKQNAAQYSLANNEELRRINDEIRSRHFVVYEPKDTFRDTLNVSIQRYNNSER